MSSRDALKHELAYNLGHVLAEIEEVDTELWLADRCTSYDEFKLLRERYSEDPSLKRAFSPGSDLACSWLGSDILGASAVAVHRVARLKRKRERLVSVSHRIGAQLFTLMKEEKGE